MVHRQGGEPAAIAEDFSFAASLALFGMQLRNSSYTNGSNLEQVLQLAQAGKGPDPDGYRGEFIRLVRTYADQLP